MCLLQITKSTIANGKREEHERLRLFYFQNNSINQLQEVFFSVLLNKSIWIFMKKAQRSSNGREMRNVMLLDCTRYRRAPIALMQEGKHIRFEMNQKLISIQ